MYRTVQMASDQRIPRGMSFVGLRASCAAVETASNPMYAKNTTPAPRRMPDQPNSPRTPVFGGMKGCQWFGGFLVVSRKAAAIPINIHTIATFKITTAVVNLAL